LNEDGAYRQYAKETRWRLIPFLYWHCSRISSGNRRRDIKQLRIAQRSC
jgi:hypothetical protein